MLSYYIIALLASISVEKSQGQLNCQIPIQCDPNARFSSIDGTCNNLRTPWFGSAKTPYKRYFRNSYQDGFESPRSLSVTGRPLPNPRVVSRALCDDNSKFENDFSHLVAIFGQFVAHDITSAATATDSNGNPIDCPCNSNNKECLSINMPSNENIMRMSCLRFTRSASSFPTFNCNTGQRDQLNSLSSFIDGTQIYGSDLKTSNSLRLFQSGLLKSSPGIGPSRSFLPLDQNSVCGETGVKCFMAGEGRTNENLGLTGLQTLFLREHNRVATELSRINPHWPDERLFHESRKIIIGMLQNIIYSQWLPVVVGRNLASPQLGDIIPMPPGSGFYNRYDPNINPGLANEFATSAFRFGHSLMRNRIQRVNLNHQIIAASVNISEVIFRTVEAFNFNAGGIDSIFLGFLDEPSSKYDTSLVDTLQNHLFESVQPDGSVIAFDLASLNINRGRDHGIPSYNKIREQCGLRKAFTFQDFGDNMTPEKISRLASIYDHPDDVDFFVGGLSENPVRDGLVGPTFACILINQFRDLKRGDRFYFENGNIPTAFRMEQLNEIKKASMSRVICNDFTINDIQQNAFLLPSFNNPRVPCNSIPMIDLNRWRDF